MVNTKTLNQLTQQIGIKSSLCSRQYAKACNEWRVPSPRLSTWAKQLRRNVLMVASRWRSLANLTGSRIDSQTSRTNSVCLPTELSDMNDQNQPAVRIEVSRVCVSVLQHMCNPYDRVAWKAFKITYTAIFYRLTSSFSNQLCNLVPQMCFTEAHICALRSCNVKLPLSLRNNYTKLHMRLPNL